MGAVGAARTNTIEGFFGTLETGMRGTYVPRTLAIASSYPFSSRLGSRQVGY